MWRRLHASLARETYALPLDAFRVLGGLLGVTYFVSLLGEASTFSVPDGVIDHVLVGQMFWFTRLGFFQPGLGPAFFYAAYALGGAAACGVAAGWRPRACAAVCYLVAVSAYRWNFIVMYVDDAIMHLLFFWLIVLPVGKTLRLGELVREGPAAIERWVGVTVPGTAMKCLLGNVCLIYLVAGLWKLESPFWRQGFALYASLRIPVGRFPDFWGPEHLPVLEVLNHLSFFIEPALPILLLLPRGLRLKWLGLLGQAGFHLGIIATMTIPFANLACLATAVLFFRGEIMSAIASAPGRLPELRSGSLDVAGRIALVFIVVLGIGMMRRLPLDPVRPVARLARRVLWVGGIGQDYQLFNWIDKKNFHGTNTVRRTVDGETRELDPRSVFPPSTRGALLQAYLHDVRWIKIPDEYRTELKQSIITRLADRYCRHSDGDPLVEVDATVQRITPDDPALTRGEVRLIADFYCRAGETILCRTMLSPERSPDCPPGSPGRE